MISHLRHTGDDVRAKRDLRLKMKPGTAVLGSIDGGWWPWSTDPAAEFPALVMALSSWVGPVRDIAYDFDAWDSAEPTLTVEGWTVGLAGSPAMPANTVVLTGLNLKRIRLLVVPPTTLGGAARAVLRSASGSATTATAEDILTSNGVSLGERPSVGTPA
jgi:hypothetical protein